jgi:hypothetical protein
MSDAALIVVPSQNGSVWFGFFCGPFFKIWLWGESDYGENLSFVEITYRGR